MVMREGATYVTAGRCLGYLVVCTARQLDCWDFSSQFLRIYLEKIQYESFSAGRPTAQPEATAKLVDKGAGCSQTLLEASTVTEGFSRVKLKTAALRGSPAGHWHTLSVISCTTHDIHAVIFSLLWRWRNTIGLLWMWQTEGSCYQTLEMGPLPDRDPACQVILLLINWLTTSVLTQTLWPVVWLRRCSYVLLPDSEKSLV